MFRTILVPIDIGKTGGVDDTVLTAKALAAAHKSSLILLYVVPSVPGYVATQIAQDVWERAQADAEKELHDVANRMELPDHTEIMMREGTPSNQILEVANEKNVDLIVIASHDPGMADYLLGSVAAKVVRHSHCSVFVTRNLSD